MVTHSPWYFPVYSQWLPVAEVALVLTLELGLGWQIPKPASHVIIKHVISALSELSNPDKIVAWKFLRGGTELTPTSAIMNLTDRHSEMPDIFLASLCETVLATNIEVWFPDWFSANLQKRIVFWVYVPQTSCLIHNLSL